MISMLSGNLERVNNDSFDKTVVYHDIKYLIHIHILFSKGTLNSISTFCF